MTQLKKNTTVRVINDQSVLYGARYVLTGKSSRIKGEKYIEGRNLKNGTTYTLNPADLKPEFELSPAEINKLDEILAEKHRKAEEDRVRYEAERKARLEREVEEARKQDEIWDASTPEVVSTGTVLSSDGNNRYTVRVAGPTYEVGDKTYTQNLDVEVYVRRGDGFMVPKDYMKREVNWSAIGTVSPATARAYARALLAAADLAEKEEV